jgi:hypothetical protein
MCNRSSIDINFNRTRTNAKNVYKLILDDEDATTIMNRPHIIISNNNKKIVRKEKISSVRYEYISSQCHHHQHIRFARASRILVMIMTLTHLSSATAHTARLHETQN